MKDYANTAESLYYNYFAYNRALEKIILARPRTMELDA